MNAAVALEVVVPGSHAAAPLTAVPSAPAPVPEALAAVFDESPKARASFYRLGERDRRGFITYIEEAKTDVTRERRAAIVAMSLIGLANDLPDQDLRGKLG